MSDQFKHIFSELKIGPVTIKNRIAMAGMGTRLTEDTGDGSIRLPSEYEEYYFGDRARGGTGLIIQGAVMVHPCSSSPIGLISGWDDRCIPGFKRITDRVHKFGGKIFVQLSCFGRQTDTRISREPTFAPSAIPCPLIREIPKEMEIEDIKEVVAAWGQAARRATEGGYDGVELHSAHTGYMVEQFLSPRTNHRTDEYGGSLENRMRFMMEVIDSMKANISPKMALGVRLSDELLPDGLHLDDVKKISAACEATGKVDYMHIDAASYQELYNMFPNNHNPEMTYVHLAAGVKEVVKTIPVFTVGKIRQPQDVEDILAAGKADVVVMGRQLICDPEWGNKAQEGRVDDIRICIACNEACLGRLFRIYPITCIYNPAVGREKQIGIGTIKPAATKKKVMVVGGGPAGMEAARVAAERGHDVSVYEMRDKLGGAGLLATKMVKSEIYRIIDWQEHQLKKLGVKIHLKTEVTSEMVKSMKFDTVVVATGADATFPEIPGIDQKNVCSEREIMDGKKVGDHIVVVDCGWGFWQFCGTIEYLATQGKKVEAVTPLSFVGLEISSVELIPFYKRIGPYDVNFIPNTVIKEISGNKVVTLNAYSGKETTIKDVDAVVFAWYAKANDGLYKALKGKVKELYRVGDCLAPRRMDQAIFEGDKIGREI